MFKYLSCSVEIQISLEFISFFQPAPAPYDHTVDEQEHTVEQWKGKKLYVTNKMLSYICLSVVIEVLK